MSHYKIEGSGRVKAQPVTSQRGTSQRQPEYIPRTKKKDFNEVVYRAIDQYPRGYEEQVKFMDRRPRFVLDKSIVSRLLAAFGRLYPRLSYEFDKMIVGLAKASENYKSYMEEMREMWKQQQNCEHMYKEPPSITLCGYYGKQGCKCHYIKKIKNPNSLQKR